MSSLSSATPIYTLPCALRWLVLIAALSFYGCRTSDGLSIEGVSNRLTPIYPTLAPGTDEDDALLIQQHAADVLASMSTSVSGGGAATAPFTDSPTLLELCEYQICREVTVAPGTARRIPYVIPPGWHCVSNQIYVVQEILELPNLDYHVEPLSVGFHFHDRPHQGLLLCASVPSTYRHRKRTRRADDYKGKPVTASLKLALQVHLERLPVPGDMRLNDGLTVDSTLNAFIPSFDRIAFGAAAWREYFGVAVDAEPPLPADIEEIMNSEAPFLLEGESAHQRVGDNHLLTLIPGRVDGACFTLDKLGGLVLQNYNNHFTAFQGNNQQGLGWNSHGYGWYSEYLTDENRHAPLAGAPYWVLLPKTVLQNSRNKAFSKQKEMITEYGSNDYQLPCVLEVATSLLAHYAQHGGARLYANEKQEDCLTCTRCLDVDRDNDPLAVGDFEASGLCVVSVSARYAGNDRLGVACVRQL